MAYIQKEITLCTVGLFRFIFRRFQKLILIQKMTYKIIGNSRKQNYIYDTDDQVRPEIFFTILIKISENKRQKNSYKT